MLFSILQKKQCAAIKEKSIKRITHSHIIQSAMAGLYILSVFGAMHSFYSGLAVASLGASTFIVFSFPNAQSSRPRFLIGGYCMGILSGLLCHMLASFLQNYVAFRVQIPACALAVFISMLLMTTLNFEHPPSAALAVAVTIDQNPVIMGSTGLGCILLLCVIKKILKKYLRNL